MNRESGSAPALWTLGETRLLLPDGSGDAGEAVTSQRKRFALLTYVALQRDHVARDSVLALLWPHLGEKASRRALRQALHFLRDALETDVFDTHGGDDLAIDPERLWCDTVALDRAFERSDMERVVDLYRGELLEGFHVSGVTYDFEFWLDEERRRVRDRAREAYRSVIRARRDAGRADDAIVLARRALRLDPIDEVSLRELVRLLDDRGERVAAIEAYEAFADRLRERLRVDPSAETQALVEAVRSCRRVRSGAESPAGLPEPATRLVGRRREIERCLGILRSGGRLLTLTGAAGIGKSRLAIVVAMAWSEETGERVVHVPLPRRSGSGLGAEIAHRAGIELRGDRPWRAIASRLSEEPTLLVLDGLDPTEDDATGLAALVGTAGGTRIVVTSPAPLHLSAEQEIPVPPLGLPPTDRPLGTDLPLDSEAVALFVERARAVDPGFRLNPENVDAVVETCRRLDGVPLAIELAAAQVRSLPVQDLARRLGDGIGVLSFDVVDRPDRQRTMEAAVRWSVECLDEGPRALLVGLGAFGGEFGLRAAERVARAEFGEAFEVLPSLAELVERGLVHRPRWVDGEPRYALLSTVRAFAADELDRSGTRDRWMAPLAEHYVEWAEEGCRHFCRPSEETWMRRVRRDRDNLGVAMAWAIERRPEIAARLASALWYAWIADGAFADARAQIERILASGGSLPTVLEADLRGAHGVVLDMVEEPTMAAKAFESALRLYRRDGNRERVGWCFQSLGVALQQSGDTDGSRRALERALEIGRTSNHHDRETACLQQLGKVALLEGDSETAEHRFREALLEARRLGDRVSVGRCLVGLGNVAMRRGSWDEAVEVHGRALATFEELGRRMDVADTLIRRAAALHRRGDVQRARAACARALAIDRDVGYRVGVYHALLGIAELLREEDPSRAARLTGGVEAWMEVEEIVEPEVRRDLEAIRSRLAGDLEADSLREVWRRGRTLSLEEILAIADEMTPPLEIERQRAGVR